MILTWAAERADEIVSGAKRFDDILKDPRSRKAAASSTEAQFRRLQREAPDLAHRVIEEQRDLAEAVGALEVRLELLQCLYIRKPALTRRSP